MNAYGVRKISIKVSPKWIIWTVLIKEGED